ncbi:MAG: hypothetical protein U1F66_08615 [bacterium]
MRQNVFNKLVWLFLAVALSACSGALDSSGGGVTGGGPVGGQLAEGTLGSQSNIQQMGDECLSPYTIKFSGGGGDPSWYILEKDQKNFPNPGIIVKSAKEPIINDEICKDCEGKTVRVIDMGDPDFNPFHEKMDFSMLMTRIWKHGLKPEEIAQARYQDFTVSAVGDVSFKGLAIDPMHVYVLLLANKAAVPVTQPTAFGSEDEFYAMTACSMHPEGHPFWRLAAFQARFNEPGSFPKAPLGNPDDNKIDLKGISELQAPAVQPAHPQVDKKPLEVEAVPVDPELLKLKEQEEP